MHREGPVRASILTRAELRSGSAGASADVDRLVAEVLWEHVSDQIADRAGAFARQYRDTYPRLGLVDYVIAATADVIGAELLTRNVRHFPMFPELEPPYPPVR
jgi:predicted nucleic acid-binding protein